MNKRNGYSRLDKIVMAGLNRMDAAIEQTVRRNEINFINEVLVPSLEYYYRLKSRFKAREDSGVSIISPIEHSAFAVNTQQGIAFEIRNDEILIYRKVKSGYPAIWRNAKSGRNCMRDD